MDEKQKGNTNVNVECPQCGTAYVIRFPKPSFIVSILDSGDMLIQRMCPIITGMDGIYITISTLISVPFSSLRREGL